METIRQTWGANKYDGKVLGVTHQLAYLTMGTSDEEDEDAKLKSPPLTSRPKKRRRNNDDFACKSLFCALADIRLLCRMNYYRMCTEWYLSNSAAVSTNKPEQQTNKHNGKQNSVLWNDKIKQNSGSYQQTMSQKTPPDNG